MSFQPYYPYPVIHAHPLPSPLYGMRQEQTDNTALIQALEDAIRGEAQAIDFYERLVKQAPNATEKKHIEHALGDEREHFRLFSDLYRRLTGREPDATFTPVQFKDYRSGLMRAHEDELEAYESYRDAYLLTRDANVRDVFFRAYTDEIEHAIRFGFMLTGIYDGKHKKAK